eukprot:CAMPEP_0176106462 /NCGR_PEP_ID=MMETSP0120_2-20121206/53426_1 /TAXON_ID=160619 /ORGANISM="Kryptoperidinium foliaceum, Strain CCMP 1326" /LENGTH=449 /DNA_ID=CAMNT_0017440585 /DNA_START=126 /DNA_END=1475 /DNA_ORIENTATION=-
MQMTSFPSEVGAPSFSPEETVLPGFVRDCSEMGACFSNCTDVGDICNQEEDWDQRHANPPPSSTSVGKRFSDIARCRLPSILVGGSLKSDTQANMTSGGSAVASNSVAPQRGATSTDLEAELQERRRAAAELQEKLSPALFQGLRDALESGELESAIHAMTLDSLPGEAELQERGRSAAELQKNLSPALFQGLRDALETGELERAMRAMTLDSLPGEAVASRRGTTLDSLPGEAELHERWRNAAELQQKLGPVLFQGLREALETGDLERAVGAMTLDSLPGEAFTSQRGMTLDSLPGEAELHERWRAAAELREKLGPVLFQGLRDALDIGELERAVGSMTLDSLPGEASSNRRGMTMDSLPGEAADLDAMLESEPLRGKQFDSESNEPNNVSYTSSDTRLNKVQEFREELRPYLFQGLQVVLDNGELEKVIGEMTFDSLPDAVLPMGDP